MCRDGVIFIPQALRVFMLVIVKNSLKKRQAGNKIFYYYNDII